MKKFFLPETGGAFKANLHCHSTVSDGRLTVEEIKAQYMKHGYSVVAFTDHDVLLDHSDLNEPGRFLALNGYELEVSEPAFTPLKSGSLSFGSPKTAHMCFVALSPDNLTQVCYHKDKYIWGSARAYIPMLRFDRDDYERVYSHEGVSEMMRLGREHGFFVTYNHPTWSLESYPEYSGYENMHAVEIWNTGCERIGYDEYNCHCFDDLLRQGKRIYALATDDNHNGQSLESPLDDSCGGWVVIRCEKLEYACVTDALLRGSFYASTGPEIKSLWAEDGVLHVTTSPAHRINFITGARHTGSAGAHRSETVSEASFRFDPAGDGYVRVEVIDPHGERAVSNPVWMDEIG